MAADIGGVPSTHINHLTPRVLDIDDLYQRMEARGITMIDEIQGPPDWEGPDVLLRQTSFKALAEDRQFRYADGSVRAGSLRVRFGEVEQRGVALTARGRDLYDRMVAEVDVRLAAAPAGTTRVEVAREVWRENLPDTERELALQGLAFFTYRVARRRHDRPAARSGELVEAGVLVPEPIVYEDFLPRSAAGIFQSNLTDEGSRDDDLLGTPYDIDAAERGDRATDRRADAAVRGPAERLAGRSRRAAGPSRRSPPTDHRTHHEHRGFAHEHELSDHRRDHRRGAAGPEGHRRRHRRDRRRHRGPHPDHR